MSFAKNTGRRRTQKCVVCNVEVEHEKILLFSAPTKIHWKAVAHRAPCGAHCAGGGYDSGEQDVHIPAFGACPRCGATDSEVARVIERGDGGERVVFHRYVSQHCRELGFRIDLEKRDGESWRVAARWGTNCPDSLEQTIEWAERYVPWLRQN